MVENKANQRAQAREYLASAAKDYGCQNRTVRNLKNGHWGRGTIDPAIAVSAILAATAEQSRELVEALRKARSWIVGEVNYSLNEERAFLTQIDALTGGKSDD